MQYCPATAFALRTGTNILCLAPRLSPEQLLDHLMRLVPGPVRLILPNRPNSHPAPPDQGGVFHPESAPGVLAACVRMSLACLVSGDVSPDHLLPQLCRDLGVPLIVADDQKASRIPASRAIFLDKPDPAHAAALVAALVRDRTLARAAAPVGDSGLKYLVDGPHEGSYSLSLLNRELALALEALHPDRVGLDFLCRPNGQDRSGRGGGFRDPGLEVLRRRADSAVGVHAVLWNSYPPYVFSRPGALSMTGSYGWEESLLPRDIVDRFNDHLDGLTVMSGFVRKTLIDNGVALPIHVVGLGLDHVRRTKAEEPGMDLGRSFRFLHVSSCFPRKGVDVLLDAYARSFTDADDVTLVIKSFPNPHNTVEEQIAALRAGNPCSPHVVLINQDLPEGRLKGLYQSCHALVAPSRGEGFGLPMAEAMLLGLPVITTGYGGQTDFCYPDNSWLIDWDFAPARSHLNRFGSVWAEPRVDHLAYLMRDVCHARHEDIAPRLDAALHTAEALTWETCARKVGQAVTDISQTGVDSVPRNIAWISTWNSPCGIAKYSEYLCAHLDPGLIMYNLAPAWENPLGPDQKTTHRCFDRHDFPETLPGMIQKLGCRTAVIQFHFTFFNLQGFARLLRKLASINVRVLVMFHCTAGPDSPLRHIAAELALADRLLVHTVSDLNLFKSMGITGNATYFPQGVLDKPMPDIPKIRASLGLEGCRIVAAFGFLMPHKGIKELIQGFADLSQSNPDLHLLLLCARYPKPSSQSLHGELLDLISALRLADRVRLVTTFLPEEQALDILAAADLIVFPYQYTGESSSAAVRFGLAARRPVLCTPLPIFQDVAEAVHFLPGPTPPEINAGIQKLLDNPDLAASRLETQNQWIAAHSWRTMARRLSGMIHALNVPRNTLHRDSRQSAP